MVGSRLAVFVTAVALATVVAGCGSSGEANLAHTQGAGSRHSASAPTLTQVRHDLAGLPVRQRTIMLRQWEILRSAARRGCPTRAQFNKLTLRLDAAAAGKARNSVFVLGCRTPDHGGKA